MRAHKKYLNETLQNFFEATNTALKSLIGDRDYNYPSKNVIKIDDDNIATPADQEEFNNDPDFTDGYSFVDKTPEGKVILIQKLNLTSIAETLQVTLDEAKIEINDYIRDALYHIDTLVRGADLRGYYALEKIISENIQTKEDVYLVLEILLELVKSEAKTQDDKWKKGLNITAKKEVNRSMNAEPEDEVTPEVDPTDSDINMAAKEHEVKGAVEDI